MATKAATDSSGAKAVIHRLSEPLSVAMAGRVNAGKSTLLNALLGEKLAVTDATECTRLVSRYVHGRVYSVSATDGSGRPTPLRFERGQNGIVMESRAATPALRSVTVTAPNPFLREMTLIDTPGLGSEDSERATATSSALGVDGGPSSADAVIYLVRHAHRTDIVNLEALRDRWAGNGSAFNVVAVLSRADEIGSARADAMESAQLIAERYSADGRLRGLATTVVPVSGLLAETGATLREEEFGWLRALASGTTEAVDRLLLATNLLLAPSASPLTVEVRRALLERFGLFGVRLAVGRFRDGTVTNAADLARVMLEVSGLERLRIVLNQQFRARARTLQALSAVDSLRRIARETIPLPAWAQELEQLESASHELAEMRTLQTITDGEVQLAPADLRRLTLLLAAQDPAAAVGLGPEASVEEFRAEAILAIEFWRTRAADPLLNRSTVACCETAIRAAERLFASI